MESNIAWPYLRPMVSPLVEDSDWRLSYVGDERHGYQPLGEVLIGWDAATIFICHRDFTIDVDALRTASRLPIESAELALHIVASTGGGRMREVLFTERLPASGVHPVSVRIRFGDVTESGLKARAALSGDLKLETLVLLSDFHGPAERFVAHTPGNRLWSDTKTVNLDGSGPRLPIIQVDFKEAFPLLRAEDAMYYVSLEHVDSLTTTVLDNIVIYVNTRRRDFTAQLAANEPEAVLELYRALTVQLAIHVFENELDDGSDHKFPEPGTVGALLNGAFEGAFPDLTASGVRAMFQSEPSKFFTRMQSNVYSSGSRI